jgi:hypothetical protein
MLPIALGCEVIRLLTSLINLLKNHDEWSHNQVVNSQNSNQEVPSLTEVSLSIYEVPLDFLLVVNDLVVVVFVILNVVNHHFSQVLLCHLLETGLESELIIVTSGFGPEIVDSLLPEVFVVLDIVPGRLVDSISLTG